MFKILAPVCLALPFAILYWLVPLFSSLTIGNDYPRFSIQQQLALMYSLEHGAFPLYVPGFSLGQSAAAATLGQLFHPLPYVASLLPSYWQGDALLINTQLRLFSLGCVHLLLFYVLKKIGVRTLLAFVLSLITIYNLRMLDLFRYGASLENFTGFIILCSFIILLALEFRYWYLIGMAIGSYLLTVGGHPQIAYIGFLGASMLTLLTPGLVVSVKSNFVFDKKRLIQYWSLVFLATLVGAVLAAPYILGFYFEFLPNNLRTDKTYLWTTSYQDSWGGVFRSFYKPLSSDVHGAFGGSALITLSLLFPCAVVLYGKYRTIAWLWFFAAVFVFLLACGNDTPVHRAVWEHFPMVSIFRVPGRFSLLILFPLLFVLVWIILVGNQQSASGGKPVVPFFASNLTILSLGACALFVVLNQSIDHMLPDSSWWTPDHINDVTDKDLRNGYYLGAAALLMLALHFELSARKLKAYAGLAGFILVVLVVLETTNSLRHGSWVSESKDQKTAEAIAAYIQRRYSVPADTGGGMTVALIDRQIKQSALEPKLARFYRNVRVLENEQDLTRYLLSERKPNEAAVLGSPSRSLYPQSSNDGRGDVVELTAFRYNQIEFSVTSAEDGLLSTNLPFRQNWHVFVDGVASEVLMANGYETAVFVSAGIHHVVFRYKSDAVEAGMLVACISLALLVLYSAWRASAPKTRALYLVSSVLPLGLFVVWDASLYGGEPLDVSYSWDSTQFPSSQNLSYSKQVSANSQLGYFLYPGLAVDGDLGGRRYSSKPSLQPRWQVDIGAVHNVGSILIHNPMASSFPISIWVSTDGEAFTSVAEISSAQKEVVVKFEPTVAARFVAIQSERKTMLGFSEVEVIGE